MIKTTRSQRFEQLSPGYDIIFREEYELLCPLVTKHITDRERSPWFNSEIKRAIGLRSRAERLWRRLRTDVSRDFYIQQRNLVVRLIRNAKKRFFNANVRQNFNNPKKL